MIQFIAVSKAFHFAILKTLVGVLEVNSPYSFDEISLSTLRGLKNVSRRRKARY